MKQGKRVLFEGAQGTMLDIDHGTYPFGHVFKAPPPVARAPERACRPPLSMASSAFRKLILRAWAPARFPPKAMTAAANYCAREGNEFGAVTGRPRRCGWFDIPLLNYTAVVNGFDTLLITKLDVLDQLDEIPVCTGYKLKGKLLKEMPATYLGLEADRARLQNDSGLEKHHARRDQIQGIARPRACLSGISRRKNRRRNRRRVHRAGAQRNHHPLRVEIEEADFVIT